MSLKHSNLFKSTAQRATDLLPDSDLLTDLLANYPAFEAAFPEACEAVTSVDLPPELAAERDALLVATAALWERWNALGRAIRRECYPSTIQ